ncbi:hypothetical protein QI339_12315 [Staphylococcus saprophyticus]|nr:hypothetical protein [Staphylococcus saprophyticus]
MNEERMKDVDRYKNQVHKARPIDNMELTKIDGKQLGIKRSYIGKIKDIIMKKLFKM